MNWWMFDNHTFRRLSDDPEEAVIEAIALQDDDTYGSFGDKTDGKAGIMVHGAGDKNEFRRGMLAWLADQKNKEHGDSATAQRCLHELVRLPEPENSSHYDWLQEYLASSAV